MRRAARLRGRKLAATWCERRRVASGSPFEPVIGFSRAIVAGRHVHVSGTAPVPAGGERSPTDAYAQARRCLEIIVEALREAGATPEHVVRTRTYLVEAADWREVGRAHGEVFGDVRPASTMVVVAGLLDPAWKVEIEADALLDAWRTPYRRRSSAARRAYPRRPATLSASTPCSMPSRSSRAHSDSVARLPGAPGANGHPPVPPADES